MVNILTQGQKEDLYTSIILNSKHDISSLKNELDVTTYEELKLLQNYVNEHESVLLIQSNKHDDCDGGDDEEIALNTFNLHYQLGYSCSVNGLLSLFEFIVKYGGRKRIITNGIISNQSEKNGYGAGPFEVFKYAYKKKYIVDYNICSLAIQSNSLDVIKHVHEITKKLKQQNKQFTDFSLYYIFRSNNEDIFKYYRNIIEGGAKIVCSRYEYKRAIENGNYGIVKILYDDGARGTVGTLNAGVLKGNIQIVKLLHEIEKIKFNKTSVKNAAMSGDYDVIKYLYDKGKNFKDVMNLVLENCDFRTIKFMDSKNEFRIHKTTIIRVIENVKKKPKNIECLQYIYNLTKEEDKKYYDTLDLAKILYSHKALKVSSLMYLVDKTIENIKN